MKIKKALSYFSKGEIILWLSSVILITVFFCIFDRKGFLSLTASLLGVTSLIFCAKGHPIGQAIIIVFSILYGIISFKFTYYGELITYVCMTLPMAVFSLISWLKNPYDKGKSAEVRISVLKRSDIIIMCLLTFSVTFAFYFILKALNTANLFVSTISVTTSFAASFLMFKRSPYYALAYAANDIVLIILWVLASTVNISYLSVTVCFIAFLANDIYGFINWKKIFKKQNAIK